MTMNTSNDENQFNAIEHFLSLAEVNSLLAPFSLGPIQLLCEECNQPLDSVLVRGRLTSNKDSDNSVISGVHRCQSCEKNSVITLLIFKSETGYLLFKANKNKTGMGFSEIATLIKKENHTKSERILKFLKKFIWPF